ncbi:MAG: lysine exporter LysO family protein [Bacteroidaceae bacterium]|nr:lysine exporter LysO family protein [Bacteroidaceae bacterium]
MFIVLLILWSSVLVGYLLRRWPQPWVSLLLTISIWLMLFIIGIEVGGNEVLVGALGQLGAEALLITVLTTLCCGAGSLLLWRRLQPKEHESRRKAERSTTLRFSLRGLWTTMHESIIIFVCFSGGCVLGFFGADEYLPARASFYSLCLLLVCVGFGIGQNEELRKNFRHIKKGFIWMPVVTIISTWIGALLTAMLLTDRSPADWLAVSSGFGYYSLSSMLITEVRGIELGTVALMYNVLREITALLLAPLLLRVFGPLAPISVGGATTADTTLPTISRVSGTQFIPIAIFHGLVVDLSVPLLVPFFCVL